MIDITSPLTAEESANCLPIQGRDKEDGAPVLPIPDNIDPKTIPSIIKATNPIITPYRCDDGGVVFYIARTDKDKGMPWCWWRHPDGHEGWKCKQPLDNNRPLLNIPNIIKNMNKSIYVGEGEKCAIALQKLFPECVAATSSGGALAALKTDWSTLLGRDVILFLDNDDAGVGYGGAVYQGCKQAGAQSIKQYNMQIFAQYAIENGVIVSQIRELPDKYDIANALDEGWTAELLKELEEMLQQKGLQLVTDYHPKFVSAGLFNDTNWPDPLPIKTELLPVEPFDVSLLPKPLQNWVIDIAHRMQCPIDQVAISVVAVVSSIIGSRCGIKPKQNDPWLVVPNLWGIIIGKPSTLKSPALAEALKPLNNLEAKARAKYDEQLKNYSMESELSKITQTVFKKQIEKKLAQTQGAISEEEKQTYKSLEQTDKPICKRYKTNDATVEKMTELLSENPGGLLLFRDELMGLFSNWDKAGHESDRTFYLESWNGFGSHTTDRIGRGTTHCNNMCVSILGGTQPSKLLGYLHKATRSIDNDGLLQRFQLFVYPDEIRQWKLVDEAPNKPARDRVFYLVEAISTLDFTSLGARTEESDTIPYFHFSEEAQTVFNAWLIDLELKKLRGNDNEEEIIIEHLAKYRKLMPALALIFHILDLVDSKNRGQVTLESAERAAAWCDYLESHARRIYGLALDKTHATSALSKKIEKRSLKDGFTTREVYRKGWSMLTTTEDVQDACDELIDAGWLREQYTESPFGKGKTVYLINPKIWGHHG
ncbi:MAG: DUF3987 domain-containing protein [Pseudomonadota bacterium]